VIDTNEFIWSSGGHWWLWFVVNFRMIEVAVVILRHDHLRICFKIISFDVLLVNR
jgi:hypothetical protein